MATSDLALPEDIPEEEGTDLPDTPAKQSLIPKDDKDTPEEASPSDNSNNGKGKGGNKKEQEKSSSHLKVSKSKSHRPQHIKIPKALQRSFSAQSNGNQQSRSISVAVFLIEKVGRLLNLEFGKDTTAGLICKMMVENLAMSSQAKDVFCVWLVSPLLQLQLKDHHQPLKMRIKWPELLRRFTTATSELIEKDEPILSFQRNGFFPLQEERKITDEKIIKRLFEEAKYNILNGNYPLKRVQGEIFGATLALTEYGKYSPQVHRMGYFRTKLPELVPYWMYKPGWQTILGRSPKTTTEQNLLAQYKELSETLSENSVNAASTGKLFLEKCWDLPFYGSVFFKGQIEKQVSGLNTLLDHPDIPVHVAINRDAIHVIDPKKNEIILGLSYDEFSWDYSQSPDESDPECFDTFWLEFDSEENENTAITQLQIFSKQAVMMDAMVQSCATGSMSLCPINEASGSPESGSVSPGPEKNGYKIRNRMERLSLSTYGRDGFELHRGRRNNFSLTTLFRRQQSITS